MGRDRPHDRPALIVWGRRDFAFGEGEAARFAKLFPRNTLIFYDDASHFLQEDVGERIAPRSRALTWTFNFVPRFFFWRGFAKPLAPEVLAMYLAPWRERTRRILVDRRFSHSRRNTILSSQACFRTICKQTRRP